MRQENSGDPAAAVELCGKALRVQWAADVLITEAAARAAIARADELASGRPLPVLLEITGVKGVTAEAGALFATEWPRSRTAIIGESPVDEVIAAFYTARHKPAGPTRFFTSETEAMAWLTENTAQKPTCSPDSPSDQGAGQGLPANERQSRAGGTGPKL